MINSQNERIKLNSRIKQLRETLGLSQDAFGGRIGITRAAISNIEKGDRNPSEQTLKSICREYDVSYLWLTEGTGDMFQETLIDEIPEEYAFDMFALIVKRYMQLSPDKRKIVKEYLESVFVSSSNSIADELKKYVELKEAGAISEEEYSKIKDKLLSKI